MNKLQHYNILERGFCLLILLFLMGGASFAQNLTTIQGTIRDSVTHQPIPFVTVQFENTNIGTFSDEEGEFRLSNRSYKTAVHIKFVGYQDYKVQIIAGRTTNKDILLKPEPRQLHEIVVRPKKEKYSKKNNPAVDLIKEVIAKKDQNNITFQDYYQYKSYDRIFFAINEFDPNQQAFKRYKFLPKYADTSIIDNKSILPVSVRETISENYYRKKPKNTKQIVKAYNLAGVDQVVDTEGLDAIVKEVFKDIDIYEDDINILFHDFIGPLHKNNAVNFYRWYLSDTVNIEDQRYVKLDFAPFNSRDVGFTGSLYISTDGSYGVKRFLLRAPKKININFIDELVVRQDFDQAEHNMWVPREQKMAIDIKMLEAFKFYVEKTQTYSNYIFNQAVDSVYQVHAPITYEEDYDRRSKSYWMEERLRNQWKDYRMDELVEDMKGLFLFKAFFNLGNVISTGYIPLTKDEKKNKLSIGTIPTFFSYNSVEGGRFRLTLSTTKNLHPHLFLYGYGAYGLRDRQFKYYGEATWAFNKVERHKDEYPKSNLTIAYKYDMNSLGQRFTQAERDNILMSLRSVSDRKMTYNRQTQISYEKEFYGGFSFKLSGQTFDETPAGSLVFEKRKPDGEIYRVGDIKTTESILALRYAPNEKFFQQKRKRHTMPSEKFVMNLSLTSSWENVLGGQYNYNKVSSSVRKDFWIAPYGKITTSAQFEKVWGEAPFPFLITPSANNSYTIQSGNFYLIEPLEFVHDIQASWEVYYHMGGWLFNRIPLLKALKWREIVGFRGFYGELSKRNNSLYNENVLVFPQRTYTTRNKTPYMEYNIGIENIFRFFRVDYVRRINYLDHPDVDKDGFRISFDLNF